MLVFSSHPSDDDQARQERQVSALLYPKRDRDVVPLPRRREEAGDGWDEHDPPDNPRKDSL